jgi:Flp pilus assembly pilin Flp
MNTVFATLYARVIWPVRQRLTPENGLEAVEYALIAALLSVVIIGAMAIFGPGLTGIFTDIAERLGTEGDTVNPGG